MKFHLHTLSVLILLIGMALGGCEGRRKVVPPPVPGSPMLVRVFRVLHTSDSANPLSSSSTNRGCRLSKSEIGTLMNSALTHLRWLYGEGYEINVVDKDGATYPVSSIPWTQDGVIVDLRTNHIQSAATGERTVTLSFFPYDSDLWKSDGSSWNPNAINVYFVGNVQPDIGLPPNQRISSGTSAPDDISDQLELLTGQLQHLFALVDDPFDTGFGDLATMPYILVNDGGFGDVSGIDPTRNPAQRVQYHEIEHEFTHYLGHFRGPAQISAGGVISYPGRSFGTTGSVYDGNEHATAPVNGGVINNILRTGGTGPGSSGPFPLRVPGDANTTGSERGQINARIKAGRWNFPN